MKIVFMGTPQAAVPSLEHLVSNGHEVLAVYSQPDRPSGRGNKIAYSPVKQFAVEHKIPILQPFKVRSVDEVDKFRSFAADVAVVVAYGRILPDDYLNAFPKDAVNVHFSLLPKYRGAAPVNWAIVNGESATGVTTMKMDSGLDTGDILLQRTEPIDPRENAVDLMSRLSIVGAELLLETLTLFDEIKPIKQDHDKATYAPIMTREDGRIDWTLTATEISCRVRGFQPYPTTFTIFRGSRLTIWQTEAVGCSEASSEADCGTIISALGGEMIVRCGDHTSLKISEVQPEGKRRMSVRDFINGVRPAQGESLAQ